MARRGLPHGRGYSPDKTVREQEFDRRRRENPSVDLWWIRRLDYLVRRENNLAITTDVLHLTPLRILDSDIQIKKARINVAGAGTAAVLEYAVYVFKEEKREFVRVPGTYVSKSIASTGLLDNSVDAVLNSGVRYFIGSVHTSSVAASIAGVNLSAETLGCLTSKGAVTTLPKVITHSSMEPEYSDNVPEVVYYSQFASEILT